LLPIDILECILSRMVINGLRFRFKNFNSNKFLRSSYVILHGYNNTKYVD